MFLIIAGSLTASLALSYAWWTAVRVIRLRQDIFDKRDDLFDLALERGLLDDPAYRVARRHLNAAANSVEVISIEFLMYFTNREETASDHPKLPISSDTVLQQAIDEAMVWCARRIVDSLFRETFSGRVLTLRFRLRGILPTVDLFRRWTHRWVTSLNPERIERLTGHPVSC